MSCLFLLYPCRCSLFLWDKERDELVAKVFDGEIPNEGDDRKVCVVCVSILRTVWLLLDKVSCDFDNFLTIAFLKSFCWSSF